MSVYLRRIGAASLLVAGCLFAQGCASAGGAAVDAGTVAYVRGDLIAVVHASPQRVTDAAEAALADMQMLNVEAVSTQADGKVTARTARDKKVNISIRRESHQTSHISIRVGVFGDETLSREILGAIESRL